jgi:TonB family protein
MARASRPNLTSGSIPAPGTTAGKRIETGKLEAEFFGARRVYTVYMNMPNLTSAAGSWVLRFAELSPRGKMETGELLTPEAVRKVDPMYVASAARERVQGIVTLAAVVLKDGTLSNVRVVGSLDPRLDSSAVSALTQWKFLPGRKNGSPVELEVLVQIPFRISSLY